MGPLLPQTTIQKSQSQPLNPRAGTATSPDNTDRRPSRKPLESYLVFQLRMSMEVQATNFTGGCLVYGRGSLTRVSERCGTVPKYPNPRMRQVLLRTVDLATS